MDRKKIINRVIGKLTSTWYHGRSNKSSNFDLKYTGKGNDEDGPGFYFTKSKESAEQYAYPNGVVLSVTLNSPRLLKGNATLDEVKELIEKAPRYQEVLSEDYNMNINTVAHLFMKQKTRKDVFEQIWYDFYHSKGNTPAYLRKLIDLGYDGHLGTRMPNTIIIYNPNVIKVIAKDNYVSE